MSKVLEERIDWISRQSGASVVIQYSAGNKQFVVEAETIDGREIRYTSTSLSTAIQRVALMVD